MGQSQRFDAVDRPPSVLIKRFMSDACSACPPAPSITVNMSVFIIFPVTETIWSTSSFQRKRCAGKQRLVRNDKRAFLCRRGDSSVKMLHQGVYKIDVNK